MRRVFSAPTAAAVHNMRNALEAEGIACEVRGEWLRTGAGEIPVNEAWPELWIASDDDWARAVALIRSGGPTDGGSPWSCPQCGETIEGQFAVCWSCGTDAPDLS